MVRYVCCSHFTATTMLWWVCVPLQSPVSFIRMIYYFSILFKACCVLDIVKVVFQFTSGISVTLGGNLVKCVSPSGGAYTRATVTLFPFAVAYLPSWSSSSSIFSTLTLLDIRVVAPPLLLFLCELKMEFVYPNLFDMFHVEISPVSCLFHKERILIVHRLYSCCWCRFSLLMNWSGCDIACCIAMVAKMPTVELSEALTEWRSNQNCAAWGWLHVWCCIHGLVLSVDSYSCVGCLKTSLPLLPQLQKVRYCPSSISLFWIRWALRSAPQSRPHFPTCDHSLWYSFHFFSCFVQFVAHFLV